MSKTNKYNAALIQDLLNAIGEDPKRTGLKGTPERVVRMWDEIFAGYDKKNKPKITIFPNGEDGIFYDEMIVDTGGFYSHCEHHMVPFFGTYWFGYIPNPKGSIIGISKVARLVDFHSAKLQIQERLTQDIVEDIWNQLISNEKNLPLGMGLIMKGQHLCKTMRGVRKKGETTTTKLKGVFKTDHIARSEFINIIKL